MSFAPMVRKTRSSVRPGWVRRARARSSRSCVDLARHRGRTGVRVAAAAIELARALGAEQPDLDRGARAGERHEGHRDMRVLDRQPERGAQLVAVERAVAGGGQPARRQAATIRSCRLLASARAAVARLVALEADAAGPEIFAAAGGDEIAKAEAVVGERDRAVGIAFAGGDRNRRGRRSADRAPWISPVARRVAPPGGVIVDRDHGATCRSGRAGSRPRGSRPSRSAAGPSPSSNDQAQVASGGTAPASRDRDPVVDRRQIGLAHAVAHAGLDDAAGAVDAQPRPPCRAPSRGRRSPARGSARRRGCCGRCSAATWRLKSFSSRNRRKRFLTSHDTVTSVAISPGGLRAARAAGPPSGPETRHAQIAAKVRMLVRILARSLGRKVGRRIEAPRGMPDKMSNAPR